MSQEKLTMGMIEEIDDGDVEECPLPYKVEKGHQRIFYFAPLSKPISLKSPAHVLFLSNLISSAMNL